MPEIFYDDRVLLLENAGECDPFIDWGDALWGAGSISIANLLATSSEEMKTHSGKIWEAFFHGW